MRPTPALAVVLLSTLACTLERASQLDANAEANDAATNERNTPSAGDTLYSANNGLDSPSGEADGAAGGDAAPEAAAVDTSDAAGGAPAAPASSANARAPIAKERFIGRFDAIDANRISFAFSASAIVARVAGTGLSIGLEEVPGATYQGTAVHNYFDVFVDGRWHRTFALEPNRTDYVAAQNLTLGEHVLRISKRTEAQLGTVLYRGVSATAGGTLLAPPAAAKRQIEFIGDSITCGLGADGNVKAANGCAFGDDVENAHATFAAQLSEAVGAEFVSVAYSGKGIVQNYDCATDPVNTMSKLYDTIIPLHDPNRYNFALWTPNAVVVNLGTNDYKMANGCPAPTDAAFVDAWLALLATIRGHYPQASIFCTVGPDLYGAALPMAENNIQAAVSQRLAAGDANVTFVKIPTNNGQVGWGCVAHPNRAMHKLVANALLPTIKAQMGW